MHHAKAAKLNRLLGGVLVAGLLSASADSLAGVSQSDFPSRYSFVAGELEKARREQYIKCVNHIMGHDGELIAVTNELYTLRNDCVLSEAKLVEKRFGDTSLFRASGGDANSCFTVMQDDPALPLQLVYYSGSQNPSESTRYMRPLFAATCLWGERLSDILSKPEVKIIGFAEQRVDPFGEVIRVEFTRPDVEHVPLVNQVYLDPNTWVILGARFAMLAHKPGVAPSHLNAQLSYKMVSGVQMPQRLEYWVDNPNHPGQRINDDLYEVSQASLTVPAGETFTVAKYGLTTPGTLRNQAGFHWLLWLTALLLAAVGVYLYARSRRPTKG